MRRIVDLREYRTSVRRDSLNRLLPLSKIPGVELDLRYAATDNFMRRRMYPSGTRESYLRWNAARGLAQASQDLKAAGYGLVVWDAYRPYAVTVRFWELVRDERYVAHPGKGSNHNRGLAVDCTLYDLRTGELADMGTGFDNFTDSAHHDFTALPDSIRARRSLLRKTMEHAGFRALDTEWWHYSWNDGRNYEVLDIPIRKLARQAD